MDGREAMALSGLSSNYIHRGVVGSGSGIHSDGLHTPPGFSPLSKHGVPVQSNVRNNSVEQTFSVDHSQIDLPHRFNMGVSSTESVKRGRGRPRKYGSDRNVSLGPSPMSTPTQKRGRGRPPGSGRKQQLATIYTKRVKVGSYCVTASLSMTLQAIINKHGDIAKDCRLESDYMRTPVLEGICKVVQDLQNIQLHELKQRHLKSFYSAVKDAECVNLNVNWLHQRLDELVQAVSSFKLKDSKRRRTQSLESIKKDLETKRVEMAAIQSNIQDLVVQLASETLDEEIMNRNPVTDSISTNFEFYERKCLTDGLL